MQAVTAEHKQHTNCPHSLLTGALLSAAFVSDHEHVLRDIALFR